MCAASRRTEGSCTKVPRLRSNDEDTPLFQIHSHSMASVLPSRHSSCLQFSAPSRAECRQVTPCRVSSASGTKVGTTFFKLRALSFLFLSQSARRTAFEIPLTSGYASISLEFSDSIWYKVIGFPLGRLPSAGDVFPGFFLIRENSAIALRGAQNPCSPSSHLARSSTRTPSRV